MSAARKASRGRDEEGAMGGLSRQRAWQLDRISRGLCEKCGRERSGLSHVFCDSCAEKARLYYRGKGGFKPWKEGGEGKPPNSMRAEKRSKE